MNGKPGKTAEQQIGKIRAALDSSGAEVAWEERAASAGRPRGAEFLLKRDGRLWIGACRAGAALEDAEWIGELAARRDSVSANAAIAISDRGFTDGAVQKARELGVIVRNLATVSDEEIRNWGVLTPVDLVFYEFRDMQVTIMLPGPVETSDLVIANEKGDPIAEREVLMGVVQNYLNDLGESFIRLRGTLQGSLLVNGMASQGISVEGRMRGRTQGVEAPVISVFTDSDGESAPARPSALILDLSQIHIPERCIFGFPILPQAENGGVGKVDVIGTDNATRSKVHLKYGLRWTGVAAPS